jgi:hypothetical protein
MNYHVLRSYYRLREDIIINLMGKLSLLKNGKIKSPSLLKKII